MTAAWERLRSLLIWAVAFPVFGVCCLLVWLASFVCRGPGLERLIKACCRLILRLCGVRLRIEGRENLVPGRPYVLMMNHVNFLDPFVFYAGFPGPARGIEEERHFRWPLYGAVLGRLGVIPVSRTDTARAMDSLRRAAALIRARPGYSFAVFPEGTRTPDGRLGAFKRGGFHLALEAGLEILPLVQIGAFRVNRKGSRLIRPGRIRFVIEAPIPAGGTRREDLGALVERVRSVFLHRLEA